MALTSGAKKFFGLLLTVAIVGGGIYGYKSYAASHPTQPAPVVAEAPAPVAEPVEIPQPINSPISQARNAAAIVDQVAPEPTPAPAPSTTSSNRGMANLMNAGKR